MERQKVGLDGIQRSINELDRLAIHIRLSSTSPLDSRVRAFASKRPAEVSFFETKAIFAVNRLYPNACESLRRHLSRSMTQRHMRLLYWQSHDKKLRMDRRRHRNNQNDLEQTRRESQHEPPPSRVSLIRNSAMETDVGPPKPNAAEIHLSNTEASHPNSRFDLHAIGAKVPAPRPCGASTFVNSPAKFPRPPVFNNEEDSKPCPFCQKKVSKEDCTNDINGRWWK